MNIKRACACGLCVLARALGRSACSSNCATGCGQGMSGGAGSRRLACRKTRAYLDRRSARGPRHRPPSAPKDAINARRMGSGNVPANRTISSLSCRDPEGYAGPKLEGGPCHLGDWTIQIVQRSDTAKGFGLLPGGWIVEWTFAWFGGCRQLTKDREKSSASAEAWVFIARIRLLTRRLARYCHVSWSFGSLLSKTAMIRTRRSTDRPGIPPYSGNPRHSV